MYVAHRAITFAIAQLSCYILGMSLQLRTYATADSFVVRALKFSGKHCMSTVQCNIVHSVEKLMCCSQCLKRVV